MSSPTGGPAAVSPRRTRSATRRTDKSFSPSPTPHLEEAYWFGEGVLPELRQGGVWEQAGAERELEVAGSAR